MLGNCVSSHSGQSGAVTGDSRCGQPGLWCVSDLRGPKSPQDNRSVSGVITHLEQVRLKTRLGEESRYKTSLKILRDRFWEIGRSERNQILGPYASGPSDHLAPCSLQHGFSLYRHPQKTQAGCAHTHGLDSLWLSAPFLLNVAHVVFL